MSPSSQQPYAEVLAFKLYLLGTGKASGQCLCLILAVAGDGDDASAGCHDLTIFHGCSGVEDNGVFAERMRIVQRDDLALLIMAGITAADEHHADGRAVVEDDGALGKIPFGDTFEELHQVALDA